MSGKRGRNLGVDCHNRRTRQMTLWAHNCRKFDKNNAIKKLRNLRTFQTLELTIVCVCYFVLFPI